MDTLPDRPTPADAPSGDGAADEGAPAPRPADSAETLDMSQVAGDRPTALAAAASRASTPKATEKKGKKKKAATGTTVPMTTVGPSEGALSPADQALAELGTKRGIETLFRSAYRVNMDLSALADAKANIMISINGLIVSILIASIAPGMESNPWLYLPTSLFLVGCLVSLVFAVLAARPRVQSQVVTKESALRDKTNVLFFGNFSHMPEQDFVAVMKEVVQDPTQIYEMMMVDIYGVGSVLQKKYRLLRKSYTVFIAALVVGVGGFIGVFGYAATRAPDPTYIAPAETAVPAESVPPGTQVGPATGPSGILP